MPAQAKAVVREFLNFDMSKPKDIYVQDQLAWGTIELQSGSSDAASTGASIVLVVPRSVAGSLNGGSVKDKASVSGANRAAGNAAVAGASSASVSGAARARQSLYAASDAGGPRATLHGRLSMLGPPTDDGRGLMWEVQSSATGRR